MCDDSLAGRRRFDRAQDLRPTEGGILGERKRVARERKRENTIMGNNNDMDMDMDMGDMDMDMDMGDMDMDMDMN
jgi:hypothetical protein